MDLGEIHHRAWGSDPSELWAQAQGAVQSHLDQEVLFEAVGLADAELADMSLAVRLQDSLGHWVVMGIAGTPYRGKLTGVTTSGDWICLNSDTIIRVGSVQRFTGLRQVVSPATSVRHHFHEKQWLRDLLGCEVRLQTFEVGQRGMFMVGVLMEVGMDFIAIRSHAHHGDQAVIDIVPSEQIAIIECRI
jgi:hypothetical protein